MGKINLIEQIDFMLMDLRQYRIDSGFDNIREVEEATGISNAYISQLETGKIKNPSWNTVKCLFMFYNNIKLPKIVLPEQNVNVYDLIQDYERMVKNNNAREKRQFEQLKKHLYHENT